MGIWVNYHQWWKENEEEVTENHKESNGGWVEFDYVNGIRIRDRFFTRNQFYWSKPGNRVWINATVDVALVFTELLLSFIYSPSSPNFMGH
jgi:hypothetical protein